MACSRKKYQLRGLKNESAGKVLCTRNVRSVLRSRAPIEKLNSVTCVCNPRSGEEEMGGPLEFAGQSV